MTDIEIHQLKPVNIESRSEVSTPTLSVAANYAEDWYENALAEVSDSANRNHKRREIVFTVCFLESYLYEWVRNYGTGFLEMFFSKSATNDDGKYYTKNLKSKWKYIPTDLAKELGVEKNLQLDLSRLGVLIQRRNGLVHASASKFSNSFTEKKDLPVPSQEELDSIESGWALDVAEKLVTSLMEEMKSDVPDYFRRKP